MNQEPGLYNQDSDGGTGARAARLEIACWEQGVGTMRLSSVPAPYTHSRHMGMRYNRTGFYKLTVGISGRLGFITVGDLRSAY